jgi:flagellar biosynthetic protein FlhB
MTLREFKEENKRTEGDPQVKAAIRSRQLQVSRSRMMAAVADADVVLVNPTHVAVALRYEPGKGAPRVVAKGAGALAARIRARAAEHNVPLVEDVPLARALHAACEVGAEIPEYLFTAVARVLAFVMALRRRGVSAGQHRVPGGSTLPADDATDHRAAGRAAARQSARAASVARRASRAAAAATAPTTTTPPRVPAQVTSPTPEEPR